MKYIDMENWPRKNHFHFFSELDYPHFNLCANVDITHFLPYIKERNIPFFRGFLYAAVKTANDIKEFRYRIREGRVVEHELVHPSFTIMTTEDVFSFCHVSYTPDMDHFIRDVTEKIEKSKDQVVLEDEPGRDDYLFITSIPWVTFTSVTHPIHMNPTDSVPRIAWGKFFEENGKWKIPVSIQAHHAVVDGAHVGEYFIKLQEFLDHPQN
ncbi:chloramphenicol acetyltransferase [Brevibacillus dissolubilis]|uniref:chloramphenicol acetyltransferase n=1 Tax=Brevibacillus dissolubilis TaxID=1844116 RepID=UPI0011165B31|nr:chloramphenicol acetyltransferase [Brevibacillus dissolubilis]